MLIGWSQSIAQLLPVMYAQGAQPVFIQSPNLGSELKSNSTSEASWQKYRATH